MIQLTAEIEIFSSKNGTIDDISDTIEGDYTLFVKPNNISCDLSEVKDKKTSTSANPFILGSSKLGDGAKLSADKVDYFISDILFDEKGEFPSTSIAAALPYEPITIEVSGNIKSLTIVFDTENGGHPQEMYVDGVRFTDDDPIFAISDTATIDFFKDNYQTHSITIHRWNKPNRPLIIQGIYITPEKLEINRKNIVSLERSIIDRSDIKLPSWGIISNGGSLEFNDPNGEIKDYAEQGLLKESQKVSIYINNTLIPDFRQKIGDLYTNEWNYDNNNRLVSLSLVDGLESWQDKVVSTSSLKEVYTLYNVLNFQFGIEDKFNIDTQTIFHLKNVSVPYKYLDKQTQWGQIVDFCVASQCYVYKGFDEIPIIKYIGGE